MHPSSQKHSGIIRPSYTTIVYMTCFKTMSTTSKYRKISLEFLLSLKAFQLTSYLNSLTF